MPLPLFGPPRLIRANSTVSVQTYTVTQSGGGTVETYANLETGVPALITNVRSSRPGDFDDESNVLTGDLSGESENLARTDARILVTASENPVLVGKYLVMTNVDSHAQGLGNLQSSRVKISWRQLQTLE